MRLATLLLLLCPLPLLADIDMPDKAPLHTIVVAKVVPDGVPEGARLRGSFSAPTGMYLPCGESTYHLAFPKGTHTVTAEGVWVLTRDVTLEGQTFPVLIDFGSYRFSKAIVVGDPGPDPPQPDPPGPNPPPVGPKQIMIFYDFDRLDNYPESQRSLLTSLVLRKELVAAGHVFLEVVEKAALSGTAPAKYKVFFDAARGKELPLLAIAPKEGGPGLVMPLPANKAALLEALK